jgi:Sec-independent protein translocase protein TatA
VGRIGKLGSEMGRGIRAFREGLQEGTPHKEAAGSEVESETRENSES